jgi:dipeptidyl aminopeptidase/acylaminoacyl peptidase
MKEGLFVTAVALIVATAAAANGPQLAKGVRGSRYGERVHAPALRALPIDTALDITTLGSWQPVALSPDHANLAYIVCDPIKKREVESAARAAGTVYDFAERWYLGCRLEITDTASGKSSAITDYDSISHGPSWSADGRKLAFVAEGGEQQRLHVWDRSSNAVRRFSEPHTAVMGSNVPTWLPDSRRILVVASRGEPAKAAPKAPERTPSAATVTVYRSQAAAGDSAVPAPGPWPLDDGNESLVLLDTVTGESRTVVPKAPSTMNFRYVLSPDGRFVAFARATRFATPTSQQTLTEIHAVSLADGRDSILARDVPMLFGWGLSWSPDSTRLAWLTGGVQAPNELTVHELSPGSARTIRYADKPSNAFEMAFSRLPRTSPEAIVPAIWHPKGWALYVMDPLQQAVWTVKPDRSSASVLFQLPGEQVLGFVSYGASYFPRPRDKVRLHVFTGNERTKRTTLHEIDLGTGRSRRLWSEDSQLGAVTGSADGQALAYIGQRSDRSPEAWFRPMPAGQPRRLTHITRDFDAYVFGRSRLIEWTGARNERLQGVLILPAGYAPGTRYPLIVFPYGGAYRSHNLHTFAGGQGQLMATTDNMQLLATRGYAVLLPDVPAHTGTLMKDFADAILPGVDAAIAAGVADPERLGIMGHSNGGYTVMSLIAQTTRFKAAISRAGFSDYTSLAFAMNADGTSYALNIAEDLQLGGSLWEERARWIDNSPLYLFDHVETPTLIVHGTADLAVHPFAADQSFVALRRLGKIVEYAKYADEGHTEEVWSRANQGDYLTRMIGWFDRFLCPQRKSETSCQ